MPVLGGGGGGGAPRGTLYAALRDQEEARFARRGGRWALFADGTARLVDDPGPLLGPLRVGDAVTCPAFYVIAAARKSGRALEGFTPGQYVTVHPDGRVVAA